MRHGLLAVRTMAALSGEVYGRMAQHGGLRRRRAPRSSSTSRTSSDRVAAMADGQREYLQGVIEFYQTRTDTKMTIAAERLAVIAAVTLPITALSSVLGHERDRQRRARRWASSSWILVVMLVMSAILLLWARRKGWW